MSPGREEKVKGEEKVVMADPGKLGLFTIAGFSIVLCQVTAEVGKQISNYSIKEFNGGHYPLPQTMLVVLVELSSWSPPSSDRDAKDHPLTPSRFDTASNSFFRLYFMQ